MSMADANSTAVLQWTAEAGGNRGQLKRRAYVSSSELHGAVDKVAARTAVPQRIWTV
jgi:hypothetical protein